MMISSKEKLSFFKFILPYLKPYKTQLIIALVALVIAASTVLFLGRGLQFLIDDGFVEANQSLLDESLIYLFIIISVLSISSFTRYFFVSWIGERVVADIRKDVFSNLIRLSPKFYLMNKTGEILSHVSVDTTVLQSVVGSSLSLALRNILIMFGGIIMLIVTSPKLTGFILVVIPFVIVPIIYWGRKVREKSKQAQDAVAGLGGYLDEALHGVTTIQSYTKEVRSSNIFNLTVEKSYEKARGYILFRAILSAMVIFIVFSAIGVMLWIGGHDVIAGTMSPGALSAFVFYAVIVAGAMGILSEVIGNLQRAAGAAERLITYQSLKSEIVEIDEPLSLPMPIQGSIEFKEMNFAYEEEGQVISSFNVSIKAGETVALVGRSGAGKTTLLNLMMRFYDPQSGDITIDGVSLKDLSLKSLRQSIGFVPQDPFIFSGSIRDNLLLAQEKASDEQIYEALKKAYIYDFVMELPDKLDTLLGEAGQNLSGGQKQRLALARTFLENSAILLLDEATSALDGESEAYIKQALSQAMAGRTCLIIAHRFSTIMHADRVLVIDEGHIVQEGTHKELIQKKGLYADLAKHQFIE